MMQYPGFPTFNLPGQMYLQDMSNLTAIQGLNKVFGHQMFTLGGASQSFMILTIGRECKLLPFKVNQVQKHVLIYKPDEDKEESPGKLNILYVGNNVSKLAKGKLQIPLD